jgi:hypothetical protein
MPQMGQIGQGGHDTIPSRDPRAGFTTDPDLADIVRPGVLWWDGATVVERARRSTRSWRTPRRPCGALPPEDSAAVRTMYKRVGLDPTKTRPSNEALLRRLRKGGQLPRINAWWTSSTGARWSSSCPTASTIGCGCAAP